MVSLPKDHFNKDITKLPGICRIPDVDLNDLDSFGRLLSIYDNPSQTSVFERLFLYSLVAGLRPARTLEIGFRFGGTSFVILCALKDVGGGRLVSLDPHPEPAIELSGYGSNFELIEGSSPGDVPRAIQALGGPVHLCHIDGDHSYEGVVQDLAAVGPHLAPDAYVLIHDAVWPEIRRATDEFLDQHPGEMIDCGFVVPTVNEQGWGGVRMLRRAGPGPGRPLPRR